MAAEPGGEPLIDEDGDEERDSEPYPRLHATGWTISERRLRICELALVLLLTFGPSLISALWSWSAGDGRRIFSSRALATGSLLQVAELALVAYVLLRRGRSFRDIGLTWHKIDLPAGGLLFIAMGFATIAAYRSLNWITLAATGHEISSTYSSGHVAGVTAITLNFLYAIIDPINEEVIVRAFTMTEVEALTGSTAIAIAASVGLQTAYHLYQGLPDALIDGAGFLLFACFFARFRRIVPVILAHMCWDLAYVLRHV